MKVLLICSMVLLLSACLTTTPKIATPAPVTELGFKRIDQKCAEQAFARAQTKMNAIGAYIATAENAEICLQDINFSSTHPDNQQAMQLQALAVNSFVKAGDMASAKSSLDTFRQKFPLQDLVYQDFTSFVDTATALLEHRNLSHHQLARLNINPTLRAELQRQQRWSAE